MLQSSESIDPFKTRLELIIFKLLFEGEQKKKKSIFKHKYKKNTLHFSFTFQATKTQACREWVRAEKVLEGLNLQ